MISGLVLTLLVFLVAVALCITIDFVVVKYVWDGVPEWVQYLLLTICIGIIFFVAYQVVAQIWGAT